MQLTLFQVPIIFVWNFSHFSLNIKQISYLSLWLATVPLTFIMEPNYKPCLSLLRDNALFILNVVWICCVPPFLLSIHYFVDKVLSSNIVLKWNSFFFESIVLTSRFSFQQINTFMYWRSIHKGSEDYQTPIPHPCLQNGVKPNINFVFELK